MNLSQALIFLVLILLTLHLEAKAETPKLIEHEGRNKRQINSLPLVYPYGATYKLLIGFTTPLKNNENINIVFAANFQYQYVQFSNITQLSQYYPIKTVSREERSLDVGSRKDERLVFYKVMEEMLNAKGFEGHACVLRAICEAAQFPVEEEGLVGELIHILLTPCYGRTLLKKDEVWETIMSEYISAQTAGKQMFSCPAIYSGCPVGQGLLELITLLRDE